MTPSLPSPLPFRLSIRWTVALALAVTALLGGRGGVEASAPADTAFTAAPPDSQFSFTVTLASQTDSRGELRPCT